MTNLLYMTYMPNVNVAILLSLLSGVIDLDCCVHWCFCSFLPCSFQLRQVYGGGYWWQYSINYPYHCHEWDNHILHTYCSLKYSTLLTLLTLPHTFILLLFTYHQHQSIFYKTLYLSLCGIVLSVYPAARDSFWWFGHSWSHSQPHQYDNISLLLQDMKLNHAFAKVPFQDAFFNSCFFIFPSSKFEQYMY